LAFLFFLFCTTAGATNYYVTVSGAGAQNGADLDNAWSEANYEASSSPGGGDTVYFSGSGFGQIVVPTSGSGDGVSRLTLDFGTYSATIDGVYLKNRSYLNVNGGTIASDTTESHLMKFDSSNGSYITIADWTHDADTDTGGNHFAIINWADNVVIENNHMTDICGFVNNYSGANNDITIRNNYVWQSTAGGDQKQCDMITLGDSINVTIEGNYFEMRSTAGHPSGHQDIIQTYEGGGTTHQKPYNWTIAYNFFAMNAAAGGDGRHSWLMLENFVNSNACYIYGNVFVGRSTSASATNGISPNANGSSSHFYFYNNTIYLEAARPGNTIRFVGSGTVHTANNVGYATSDPGTFLEWEMSEGGDWDYNHWSHDCSAAYRGPNGGCSISASDFINPGDDNFSLASESDLVGAGTDLGSPYNYGIAPGATWPDPELVERTGTWDVGAYEYEADTTPSNTIQGVKIGGGS